MQRLNNSEEGTHFRSFVYCAGAGVGRFWGGEVVKGDMEAPAGSTNETATLKYGGQKQLLTTIMRKTYSHKAPPCRQTAN